MPHINISKCITLSFCCYANVATCSLIIKLLHLRNRIDSLYPVPNVLRAAEGIYFFYTKRAFVHCLNFIESVVTTRRHVQEGSTVLLNI